MVDFLRRSWAVVDLDCIDHNIRSIKEKLKPGCMIMGVVKADAYGHGDKYIADELVRLGVNWFAVSNLTEAMSLRNQGIYHPCLLYTSTTMTALGWIKLTSAAVSSPLSTPVCPKTPGLRAAVLRREPIPRLRASSSVRWRVTRICCATCGPVSYTHLKSEQSLFLHFP